LSEHRDFWLACGHHLVDRDAHGRLIVTDEFLKAYLARPELAPPADACAAERSLHRALLTNPRQRIAPAQVSAIADGDARDNWELLIAWRDHLVRHDTLEAAYLDGVRRKRAFPLIFINQLVQLILRNLLDDCADAFVLRAAELFFRTQQLSVQDGRLVSADEETIAKAGAPDHSPLSAILGLSVGSVEALSEGNAECYWPRSDRFDLALDLTAGARGLAALGEVICRWVAHLLGVDVQIIAVSELRNVSLDWYLGLDAEATRIGDALWNGAELDAAARARLVGLYELKFLDAGDMDANLRGAPTYLLMAMTPERRLRFKPQNLLTGLPIRRAEALA
jgi:hypothetical protein